MNSHNEMLLMGTNSGSSALPSSLLRVFPSSPHWHTSCPITASMWKQGCIQSNRCPNHVHVPRHPSALRVSPSSLHLCNSVNLTTNNKQQKTLPLAPATYNLLTNTYKNFHLPRRISRNFAKFRSKFFHATANLQTPSWNPHHSRAFYNFESVLKIRSICKLGGCAFLKVLKVFFSSSASQSGQHANVTTNMNLFCKCL
jgi:hypothetical protein